MLPNNKPTVVSSSRYEELLKKEQQLDAALLNVERIKARFKLKEQRWHEHQDYLSTKSMLLNKIWDLLITTRFDDWPKEAKSAFNIVKKKLPKLAASLLKRIPKPNMITLEEIEKAVITAVNNVASADSCLDDTLDKWKFDELDNTSLIMEIEDILEISLDEDRFDFTKTLKELAATVHSQLA